MCCAPGLRTGRYSGPCRPRHRSGSRRTPHLRRPAKVVLADRPAGREFRHGHLVRPVRAVRSRAGLLDTRVHGERRTGRERGHAEQLPSRSCPSPTRGPALEAQFLNRADRKGVRDVESGRALLPAKVVRILSRGLQHGTRACRKESAEHSTGVVDRLTERVTRLKAQSCPQGVLSHGSLQRVVGGV